MQRMRVALFGSRERAEPIVQWLRQHGITAELDKPRRAWLWFVSQKSAGVQVVVPGEQFERAEQLLLDWDAAEGALHEAIRCPECKSFRVDYPQFARNAALVNLGLGIMSEIGLVEKDYYCEDCHFTWPKQGTRPRRRAHMAPYYFIEGVEQTTRKSAEGEQRRAA